MCEVCKHIKSMAEALSKEPVLAAILIYDAPPLEENSMLMDEAVTFAQVIQSLGEYAGPIVRWLFEPIGLGTYKPAKGEVLAFKLKGLRRGERALIMHSRNYARLMKMAQPEEKVGGFMGGPRIVDLNKEKPDA